MELPVARKGGPGAAPEISYFPEGGGFKRAALTFGPFRILGELQ